MLIGHLITSNDHFSISFVASTQASGAHQYRDPRDSESTWMITSIFTHFRSTWKTMLSDPDFLDLHEKFYSGMLDTELHEKSKVMAKDLQANQFRFLGDYGCHLTVNTQDAGSELELQKAELTRFNCKLAKEQGLFVSFRKQLDAWEEAGLAQQAEEKDRLRKQQRACIEKKQDHQYPVMDLPNMQAAVTFTEATLKKFILEEEKTSCGAPLRLFWMNSSTLGYDALSQVKVAIKELASIVASEPSGTAILLALPSVGPWGNEYVESEISEVGKKIGFEARQPHLRLQVREISMHFQESTIPIQSKRAGYHRFLFCVSDQVDGQGNPLSLVTKSMLWKRQTVANIPMQNHRQFVDPRRNFQLSGSSLTGGNDLSKPARKKQHLAGYPVFAGFLDSILAGLGKDSTAVMLIHDVFAYDVSVAEAVMRKTVLNASGGGIPTLLYVGTCWSDCNSREPQRTPDSQAQQNLSLCNWLRTAVRRKLHELATEGTVKIQDWVKVPASNETRVMPKLDESQFGVTMPTAGKSLAVRQTALDTMKNKITDAELLQDFTDAITAHNKVFNPKGVAYVAGGQAADESNKRAAEAAVVQESDSKRRKVDASASSLDEIRKNNKQQLVEIPHPQGAVYVTADGQLFFQAKENVQLLPSGPPVCLVFGKFHLNDEAGTSHCH